MKNEHVAAAEVKPEGELTAEMTDLRERRQRLRRRLGWNNSIIPPGWKDEPGFVSKEENELLLRRRPMAPQAPDVGSAEVVAEERDSDANDHGGAEVLLANDDGHEGALVGAEGDDAGL